MGGLFLLLCGLLICVYFADDPPFDDAHLLPTFPAATGSENGLTVFCRKMPNPSNDHWGDLPSNFMELKKEDHQSKVDVFLGKCENETALFEELLNSDPTAWRWPDVDEKISPSAPLGYLTSSVLAVSRLNATKVLQLQWRGRHREAAEQAIKGARFGNALTKIDGLAIHLLMGFTIQIIGEKSLKGVVVDSGDPALLEFAQRELEEYDVESKSVARALKVEWLYAKNHTGPLDAATYDVMGMNSWQRLAARHLYLENRAAALSGRHVTMLVGGLEMDWTQGCKAFDAVARSLDNLAVENPSVLLRPNAGGKIMVCCGLNNLLSIGRRGCGTSALHRMAILNLALRRFELAHGRMPGSLDELVPTYLAALPLDPFDGQPMRWEAQKRWVYSVGNNGVDDRGDHQKPERTVEEDIVVPYWWLPEPEQKPPSALPTPMRRSIPTKSRR